MCKMRIHHKSCEQKQLGENPFSMDRTDIRVEKSLSKAFWSRRVMWYKNCCWKHFRIPEVQLCNKINEVYRPEKHFQKAAWSAHSKVFLKKTMLKASKSGMTRRKEKMDVRIREIASQSSMTGMLMFLWEKTLL